MKTKYIETYKYASIGFISFIAIGCFIYFLLQTRTLRIPDVNTLSTIPIPEHACRIVCLRQAFVGTQDNVRRIIFIFDIN